MSHTPFNKVPFLHLTFSAAHGFQYYRTLPKYFAEAPELPRQIRWALGFNAALARELAAHLNEIFAQKADAFSAHAVKRSPRLVLQTLNRIHAEIRALLKTAQDAWRGLPTPTELAKSDLERGFNRLQREIAERHVLYTTPDSSEIIFALTPSPALCKVLCISFARFDWPLGTSDQAVATDAAIYIFAAIETLETAYLRNPVYELNPFSFGVLALYEYLLFARPDHGAGIKHLPQAVPQALESITCRPVSQSWADNLIALAARVVQEESGLYVLRINLRALPVNEAIRARDKAHLELLTSSPIVAMLLMLEAMPRLYELAMPWLVGCDDPLGELDRSLQEMADLLRRMLSPITPAEPMYTLPGFSASRPSEAEIDPAQQALVNALGALIPPAKKLLLEQVLFQNQTPGMIQPRPELSESLSLAGLVERFEKHQVSTGSWSNPRTLLVAQSRLEALCELLGAHRSIDTLKRSDFLALRDQLRQYPKNRHRLRALRHLPLTVILERGGYEPLNPRTAKKVFELTRALMAYAFDHELLTENPAAGLAFSTKGADAPRKRTYSTSQIESLLRGPLYTMCSTPRWRLDDFKFWLPLLGLFTGARLSELSQLKIGDVRQELGTWIICIRENETRRLKTASSERIVPLHHALVSTGFLEFHQQRLASLAGNKHAPLFENVRVYGTLAASHVASRWYLGDGNGKGGYLALCGLAGDRLTFHGLRHTFINQFRRQKLDLLIAKALVGHADRTTTGGYGDVYPADVLAAELDQLDYGLDLSHIHYRHFSRLRDLQGPFKAGRPATHRNAL